MKKILHHIVMAMAVFVLGGTVSAHAETVSQRQAKHIAQQFFNAAYGRVMGEPKLVYNGRRLTTNSLFPPFYVYNLQAGGFVVISAENKAFPILGYDLNLKGVAASVCTAHRVYTLRFHTATRGRESLAEYT